MSAAVTVTDITDALQVIAAASRMNVVVSSVSIAETLTLAVDDPDDRTLLAAWLGIESAPRRYRGPDGSRGEEYDGTWSGHTVLIYGPLPVPTDDDRPVGEIPALEGVGL